MKVLAISDHQNSSVQNNTPENNFTDNQKEILRNSICTGISNDDFEVFILACIKTRLDPFMRQIYAVPRKSKLPNGQWVEKMTIQTGIDGYRLIAERTGLYAPGPEPTYTYDTNGAVFSATAYVKKLTRDGTWHIVSSSAYVDEYMQKKSNGEPAGMWAKLPRTMLAKCAESQALRRSFPAEMSGVYTAEEMQQSDIQPNIQPVKLMTSDQVNDLEMILGDCSPEFVKEIYNRLFSAYKTRDLRLVPETVYAPTKKVALKRMSEYVERQKAEFESKNNDEIEVIDAVL